MSEEEVITAIENEFDGIDKFDIIQDVLGLRAIIAAQAKELKRLRIVKGTGKCDECPFNPHVGE